MKYGPGDLVKVREGSPSHHHRTPDYIKGRTGRIEALCGLYHNPETRAHGGTGLPKKALYRVEFAWRELWEGRGGAAGDKVHVDVFEQWLEPV